MSKEEFLDTINRFEKQMAMSSKFDVDKQTLHYHCENVRESADDFLEHPIWTALFVKILTLICAIMT